MPAALRNWTLSRRSAGECTTPTDLAATPGATHPIAAPTTVGALLAGSPWVHSDANESDPDDYDWWYHATAECAADSVLSFDGITFPATVFIDGEPAVEVASMFLPVRVELDAGVHEVHIHCASLNSWLRTRRGRGRWRSTLVASQGLRWARTTLLGRAPVYGGDVLPAPVGLWRPVELDACRADDIRITAVDGQMSLTARIVGADDVRCVVHDPAGAKIVDETLRCRDGAISATLSIADPELWWPRGYGEQSLYRLQLLVGDQVLTSRSVGFATTTVDTSDDGFTLSVNDVEIFVRGTTWAPTDPVGLTVDSTILSERIASFADAGATMLRVVGGLTYEQPEFYQLCAEQGLLVWQDAMQATFDPPDEVGEVIATEVAHLLALLSGNPALAVVSGGSETIQQPEMFGVAPGRRSMPLLTELLPETVSAMSTAAYVPSSPWSARGLAIRPDVGVAHWFGVGGYQRRIDDVRTAGVRFAAESLAFAIPPSDAAIERDFGSLSAVGHHPRWKAGVPRDRTASWDFEDIRDHYVREVFGVDPLNIRRVDPARYLLLGRMAVAEAMGQCYRFWRQRDSRCAGALTLGGIDLMPGAGWGLLAHDGAPKAPLAVLGRLWATTAITIADAGLSGLRIDVHHDGPQPLRATVELHIAGSSTPLASQSIDVAPHSSLTMFDADLTGEFADLSAAYRFGPPRSDAVEVRLVGSDGTLVSRDVVVLTPPTSPVTAHIDAALTSVDNDTWKLRVVSSATLRYVHVEVANGDAADWVADDDYFPLIAGLPYEPTLRRVADTAAAPRVLVSSVDAATSVTVNADRVSQ